MCKFLCPNCKSDRLYIQNVKAVHKTKTYSHNPMNEGKTRYKCLKCGLPFTGEKAIRERKHDAPIGIAN